MNQSKYISLSLAKKIAEVAKEKGVELPEAETKWCCLQDWRRKLGVPFLTVNNNNDSLDGEFSIPAYDTFELGEILPIEVSESQFVIERDYQYIQKADKVIPLWHAVYKDPRTDLSNIYENADTMAEAMGKMLLYLLENDLFPQRV